jgi:tetratricopeptide (TPR) repeat protein
MRKFSIFLIAVCIACGFKCTLGQLTVGATLFEGGMRAYKDGRYAEAERLFRLVIVEVDKVAEERNPLAAGLMSDTLSALSAALVSQGKLSEAETLLLRQIELLEKERPKNDADFSQTSAALNNLGLVYSQQKRFREAEETHRKAIRLREKYDPPPHRNLAISLVNLGKVFYDEGKYLEAEPFFLQAQSIFLAIEPAELTREDIDVILKNQNNLALIAMQKGFYKEAEKRLLVLIEMTEGAKGRYHPDLVEYLNNYAKLLRLTGRGAAAKKTEARAALISRQD